MKFISIILGCLFLANMANGQFRKPKPRTGDDSLYRFFLDDRWVSISKREVRYFSDIQTAFTTAKRYLQNDSVFCAYRDLRWIAFFDSAGIHGWRSNDIMDSLIRDYKHSIINRLQGKWILVWQGSTSGRKGTDGKDKIEFNGNLVLMYRGDSLIHTSRYRLKQDYRMTHEHNVIDFFDMPFGDLEIIFRYEGANNYLMLTTANCACGCVIYDFKREECNDTISTIVGR